MFKIQEFVVKTKRKLQTTIGIGEALTQFVELKHLKNNNFFLQKTLCLIGEKQKRKLVQKQNDEKCRRILLITGSIKRYIDAMIG